MVVLKLNREAEASTSLGSQLSLLAAGGDHHSVQALLNMEGKAARESSDMLELTGKLVVTAARNVSCETRYVKQQASNVPVSVSWLLSSSRGSHLQQVGVEICSWEPLLAGEQFLHICGAPGHPGDLWQFSL